MQDADKILEALRPAHLPAAHAAAGWADLALPIAAGLVLALLVALLWPTRIRGRRRMAVRALAALQESRTLPPEEAIVAQARLLRRVVAARDGAAAAALPGSAFAAHCDKSFGGDFFSAGPGRRLTVSLYAPAANDDRDGLADGLEGLFRRLRA